MLVSRIGRDIGNQRRGIMKKIKVILNWAEGDTLLFLVLVFFIRSRQHGQFEIPLKSHGGPSPVSPVIFKTSELAKVSSMQSNTSDTRRPKDSICSSIGHQRIYLSLLICLFFPFLLFLLFSFSDKPKRYTFFWIYT